MASWLWASLFDGAAGTGPRRPLFPCTEGLRAARTVTREARFPPRQRSLASDPAAGGMSPRHATIRRSGSRDRHRAKLAGSALGLQPLRPGGLEPLGVYSLQHRIRNHDLLCLRTV